MAFSVADFHDLVRLLEERPEWRAQLRQLLLPEELLALPAAVRELTEQVQALAAAQQRTEEALLALTRRFDHFEWRFDRLEQRVDTIDGEVMEIRYDRHAYSYFAPLLRRIDVLGAREIDALLDPAADSGALGDDDAAEIRRADLIVRGRRKTDGQPAYLVVEVSSGFGLSDVQRAARRAAILSKVVEATPVVAGRRITSDAEELATQSGVTVVQNGEVS